jgi:hypothetical protein
VAEVDFHKTRITQRIAGDALAAGFWRVDVKIHIDHWADTQHIRIVATGPNSNRCTVHHVLPANSTWFKRSDMFEAIYRTLQYQFQAKRGRR